MVALNFGHVHGPVVNHPLPMSHVVSTGYCAQQGSEPEKDSVQFLAMPRLLETWVHCASGISILFMTAIKENIFLHTFVRKSGRNE